MAELRTIEAFTSEARFCPHPPLQSTQPVTAPWHELQMTWVVWRTSILPPETSRERRCGYKFDLFAKTQLLRSARALRTRTWSKMRTTTACYVLILLSTVVRESSASYEIDQARVQKVLTFLKNYGEPQREEGWVRRHYMHLFLQFWGGFAITNTSLNIIQLRYIIRQVSRCLNLN